MSNAFNSIQALAQAILDELAKTEGNTQHGTINISYDAKCLPNGIEHCSVQVECGAGCGWLIEACEGEAEALKQKAIGIKGLVQGSAKEDLKSLREILLTVFPEFVLQRQAAMSKGVKESKLGGPNGNFIH